jgi:hypothetical protein
MAQIQEVWIFHGANAKFASAVFQYKDEAVKWIERCGLTGVLTLDCLERQRFRPLTKLARCKTRKRAGCEREEVHSKPRIGRATEPAYSTMRDGVIRQ